MYVEKSRIKKKRICIVHNYDHKAFESIVICYTNVLSKLS